VLKLLLARAMIDAFYCGKVLHLNLVEEPDFTTESLIYRTAHVAAAVFSLTELPPHLQVWYDANSWERLSAFPATVSKSTLVSFRDKHASFIVVNTNSVSVSMFNPLRLPIEKYSRTEKRFRAKLQTYIHVAKQYLEKDAQAKAFEILPANIKNYIAYHKGHTSESDDFELELVRKLLKWFKIFFSWMNIPQCDACRSEAPMKLLTQSGPETDDEIVGQAQRVEIYCCETCGARDRFPRYNLATMLLKSRKGRCGEWANAFTLIACATGLKARIVLDWTDHVWTEIWSTQRQRWIHTDSCESALDTPLLYSNGWGKKLSYCIAVSVEGCIDVTPRYVEHWRESGVLNRRLEVSENWLQEELFRLTFAQRNAHNVVERSRIYSRIAVEIEELALMKTGQHLSKLRESRGGLPGRTSGSREWIASRGEDGK